MILKKLKTLGVTTLSLCVFALPGLAKADLTIHNNSLHPSTTKINGTEKCSSKLPLGYGITPAHTDNVIPQWVISIACMGHQHPCKADVYMTDDCTGERTAEVVFDTDEEKGGILEINYDHRNGYDIDKLGPLEINIQGGPPAEYK